jgi:hypothetical protein
MKKLGKERKKGIQWGLQERLEDSDSVNNIHILSQFYSNMHEKMFRLQTEAEAVGSMPASRTN